MQQCEVPDLLESHSLRVPATWQEQVLRYAKAMEWECSSALSAAWHSCYENMCGAKKAMEV